MANDLVLPKREQDLYDLLAGKGDVAIDDLFRDMGGPEYDESRNRQQWLGPYVTKLNRRLKKLKIKVRPGVARGTYRLEVG